ncbi:MAG: hypothetical protein AAB443_01455 [Patescibacteria group bacterium]
MDKKLLVKVQKVGSPKEEKTLKYSCPLVIEPEDEVSVRRGSLYAVIDVSSEALFDPTLIKKVVSDTFQSEYFNEPEGTPLQRIEKAASVVRDKVFSLLQDPRATSGISEFHVVLSILWGSVLYVIQYGYGCSYLIREGRIKPINTLSEGDFSVASGVVRDSDVVVLGSRAFCEAYSPEALMKSATEFLSKEGVSAIVLKFNIDSDASNFSVLDFKESPGGKPIKLARASSPKRKKVFLIIMAFVIGSLLFSSVFSSFKKTTLFKSKNEGALVLAKGRENLTDALKLMESDKFKAKELLTANKNLLEEAKKGVSGDVVTEIDVLIKENLANLDIINKILRVVPDVLYDVRVDDKDADPSELSLLSLEKLVLADSKRNKLYELKIFPSIAFSVVESTQAAKPKFLSTSDLGIYFLAEDAFYFLDSGNGKISKSDSKFEFPLTNVLAASSYIGNFYVIKDGSILKNTVLWTNDGPELREALSMAIDGSIYIVTKAGTLTKFTSGKKEAFSLKGFDGAFNNPIAVYTTPELVNLYVLENSGRIVIFDKEGNYVRQILLSGDVIVPAVKSFAVSKDGTTAYILAGSKVYKLKLTP